MSGDQLIRGAAAPTIATVRTITADQLAAPTPCTAYDVRGLVNHLLFWGPSLAGAGRKEAVPPPADAEDAVDLTHGDVVADLVAQLERITNAWSAPDAWRGVTHMGPSPDLPAATVGGMVLGELVVHGWDLARATGQQPAWDDDVLTLLHRETEANADMGRELGIYGPAVAVPAGAPLLHHILGLTGRPPAWTPTTTREATT